MRKRKLKKIYKTVKKTVCDRKKKRYKIKSG